MFIAVPLTASGDSDALTNASAGYVIDMEEGVTEAEVESAGFSYDFFFSDAMGNLDVEFASEWYDLNSSMDISIDKMHYKIGRGGEVSGDVLSYKILSDVGYSGVTAKYVIDDESPVFRTDLSDSQKKAADAIEKYFGTDTFSVGDVIEVTGDYSQKLTVSSTSTYSKVDDTYVTVTESQSEEKASLYYSLTVKYTPAGSSESKTITLFMNSSADMTMTMTYEFDTPIADLKDGDKCNVALKYTLKDSSINSYATVDGTKYAITDEVPSDKEVPTLVILEKADDITPSVIQTQVTPSEHISVDNTYSGFCEAFDELAGESDDGMGDGVLYVIAVIIIVGMVAQIIFLAIRKQ